MTGYALDNSWDRAKRRLELLEQYLDPRQNVGSPNSVSVAELNVSKWAAAEGRSPVGFAS